MWKNLPKQFKFILYFLGISAVLVGFWKLIAIAYLYLLAGIAKPVWSLFGYPVQLVIKDNILHFVYIKISQEPISFSVLKADEIYLNLVLIAGLFGASYLTSRKKILRDAIISLGILFVIHEFILFIYSYTNIWEYIGSAETEIQETLTPAILMFFSSSTANNLNYILFHWNTWGWDVIPLMLWLAWINKFIFLKK